LWLIREEGRRTAGAEASAISGECWFVQYIGVCMNISKCRCRSQWNDPGASPSIQVRACKNVCADIRILRVRVRVGLHVTDVFMFLLYM